MAKNINDFNGIQATVLPSKVGYAGTVFSANTDPTQYAAATAHQLEIYRRQHGSGFATGFGGTDAEHGVRVLTRLGRFKGAETARDIMLKNPANINQALIVLAQGNSSLDDVIQMPIIEQMPTPDETHLSADESLTEHRVGYWFDQLKLAPPIPFNK